MFTLLVFLMAYGTARADNTLATTAQPCDAAVHNDAYVDFNKLGFVPTITFAKKDFGFGSVQYRSEATNPQTKAVIGRFHFTIDRDDPKQLNIDDLSVTHNDLGIDEELLASAVRQQPQVTEVRSYFVGNEKQAVISALRKTKDCIQSLLTARSAQVAIRLGFINIVGQPGCSEKGGYYIVLGR